MIIVFTGNGPSVAAYSAEVASATKAGKAVEGKTLRR